MGDILLYIVRKCLTKILDRQQYSVQTQEYKDVDTSSIARTAGADPILAVPFTFRLMLILGLRSTINNNGIQSSTKTNSRVNTGVNRHFRPSLQDGCD